MILEAIRLTCASVQISKGSWCMDHRLLPLSPTATTTKISNILWLWGRTKAMHEFLVLHYLATDSAQGWESLLNQYLPRGRWLAAIYRRAFLMNMFDKCHIAPSYRRLAHQSWASSMNLILDLLFGNGKFRYMSTRSRPKQPVSVRIRGFSAGSYSGLSLCHILWEVATHVSYGCIGRHCASPCVAGSDFLGPKESDCCSSIMSEIPYANGTRTRIFYEASIVSTVWFEAKIPSFEVTSAMLNMAMGTG